MKCKYLILGNGFMGKKFNAFLEDSIISEAFITNKESVETEIKKYDPEVVINCIGQTGRPNIDWCETHKEETFEANVLVPFYIAQASKELNKKMVHIGSGCIYEGDKDGKGFTEEDEPNFKGSFYSRTKSLSEKILKEFNEEVNILQIRIRMPIDSQPSQRNLLDKLLKYNKMISISNSITVINDMLEATKSLIDKDARGIFNVVNKGPITHEEIIKIFHEISGKEHQYELISLDELDNMTKARRSNCVLSTEKLESMGIKMPDVRDSLRKCITDHVKNAHVLKNQ